MYCSLQHISIRQFITEWMQALNKDQPWVLKDSKVLEILQAVKKLTLIHFQVHRFSCAFSKISLSYQLWHDILVTFGA